MENTFSRKKYVCPRCGSDIPEAFLEQNPFPEVPCPSCGNLVESVSIGNAEYTSNDQRESRRCRASLKVTYNNFREFIAEYTTNVGQGGMFIHTMRRHEMNETVDISLHVPGIDRPLGIVCEVVRIHFHNVSDEEAGIGVKFIEMDEQSRKALISYVSSLEDCDG